MTRSAARLIVEGRVQGVGYRWWAVEKARRLGLDGWVRNRTDGSVEILAIGESSVIERLAEVCREGPLGSSVRQLRIKASDDDGSTGFEQRATA